MKRPLVILSLVLVVVLSACASVKTPVAAVTVVGEEVSVPGGKYTDVTAVDLHSMLDNKDFTLVNVHIPFEGNLDKTDLSIPYDQIEQYLDKLPGKDAKIVLYCRSGRMSAMAAETLVGLGYTNVWNLSGGMAGWEQAGFTINR